jgi:hypothetical protein
MAGLEADTSSYNQPLPVSPLDMTKNIASTRSAVQQNISNDTKIASDKLQLMATQFNLMNNELANLIDSGATKPQAAERLQRFSKTLNLPPVAVDHMMQELNAAPDVATFAKFAIRRGMDTMQKYGVQLGTNENQTDGATNYQGVRASPEKGGGFTPSTQSAQQPGPTQPTVNNNPNSPNYLQPGIVGPAAAPGFAPSQGGLPVAPPAPMAAAPMPSPRPRPAGLPVEPITPSVPVSGPSGPTQQTGFDFKERFAGEPRIVTGAPPGVASAISSVREQSGKDYASALTRAGNAQVELQPDLAVLDIVKGKAPGDFGPGTDSLNQLKKVAVTWLPNVEAKLIEQSGDYDTVKKYLIQGARSAGNTGTNDQLAAAFEGSPNTTMNTATIESIVKTRVALKKMEAAQALLFEKENLPPSEFSKWKAKNQNVLDPRAFGWDLMSNEARQKLVKRLTPKEYQKLETSIQFANDANLIEPPARK